MQVVGDYGGTEAKRRLAANPLQKQPASAIAIGRERLLRSTGAILVNPVAATTSEGRVFGERR
jgi:hypothetical protein